ncbi:DHA2 family efflux MFS transporter permease subunit [Pseudochelatococcus sp. B33]
MTLFHKSEAMERITERVSRSRFIVPYIVGFALFMQLLDSNVVAMALPEMARTFGEDPVRMNIVITSYLLSVSVFIPVCGWVADRFGARNVFVAAIALFTVSSVFCGLANSLVELVAARLLQGLAGAMMVPVGRIVMLKSVSKADLMQAMAFLTVPALMGPVLGPPVGGLITSLGSWRWIFLMNVPVGIVGVVMACVFIKNLREERVPPLDWRGFLLMGTALACLVLGFEMLSHGEGSWRVSTLVVVTGAAALWLYARHARRTEAPLIDFSLMKIKTFSASVMSGNLCRFDISASPFLLALLLQVVFGLSPVAAGVITASGAVGAIVAKFLITPLFQHFGFRTVLVAGGIASGFAISISALFTPTTPHLVMMLVLFVSGIFRSTQLTGVNTLTFADIPSERMSAATTLSSMMQQLAFSVGVGIAALTLQASVAARGAESLTIGDVRTGIVVLALLTAASALGFSRLAANAGDEVSKHRSRDGRGGLDDPASGAPH